MRESLFVPFVGVPRKRVPCMRCKDWIILPPTQASRESMSAIVLCKRCKTRKKR